MRPHRIAIRSIALTLEGKIKAMLSRNPMATVRLMSAALAPRLVEEVLLGSGVSRAKYEFSFRPGVWLGSTDPLPSANDEVHLRAVYDLVANKVDLLRAYFADLTVDFSLIVFGDREIGDEKLVALLSAVRQLGDLDIEFAHSGSGLTKKANGTLETYSI